MQIITQEGEIQLRYGAMWNGTAEQVTGPGTLTCNNGFITNESDTSTAPILDYSTCTIMPALIDCHVHLELPYKSPESLAERAEKILKSGIAAVREAGSRQGTSTPATQLAVINTIHALHRRGYYGSNLGTAVDDVHQAKETIKGLAAAGTSQIKLIASGIFSFTNYGETGPAPFTAAELKGMVDYAHKLGLKVMAHATGDEAVRRCLQAQVDSIEHGYFMSEQTLIQLANSDVAWIPTMVPVAVHLNNPELLARLTSKQRETLSLTLKHHRQLISKGFELGICIGAGTDAGAQGVPHGPSLYWELEELSRSGLSNHAALQAATVNAAKICALPELGQIAVGKKTALLVTKDNPLHHLATLQEPLALILSS